MFQVVMGNQFEITIDYGFTVKRLNQLAIDCTIGELPILNHISHNGQKQPIAVSRKRKTTQRDGICGSILFICIFLFYLLKLFGKMILLSLYNIHIY